MSGVKICHVGRKSVVRSSPDSTNLPLRNPQTMLVPFHYLSSSFKKKPLHIQSILKPPLYHSSHANIVLADLIMYS